MQVEWSTAVATTIAVVEKVPICGKVPMETNLWVALRQGSLCTAPTGRTPVTLHLMRQTRCGSMANHWIAQQIHTPVAAIAEEG